MTTITVKDASGANVAVARVPDTGRAAATGSLPVVLSNEDQASLLLGRDPDSGRMLIGTAQDRFIEHWGTYDTSPSGNWELVQSGTGIVISGPLGGAAAGSKPYLNINSGTTASARTEILSRAIFKPPFDLRLQVTASQRIADCTLRIGFLECDPVTGALVTATTPATAVALDNARNAVAIRWDGTVATTEQLETRVCGSAVKVTAMAFGATNTSVATGTGPDFIAPDVMLLHVARERVLVRHHNIADTQGSSVVGFSEDSIVPDGNAHYRLCVIIENGATPPASATDWRIHGLNVLDGTRVDVSPRLAGYVDATQSFPVSITSFPTGVTTATLGAQIAEDAASGTTGIPAMVRAANANPAAMSATGDAVRPLATMIGALIAKPYALPEAAWNANLSLTTTTAAALAAAGGAGLKRHITALQAINTGASAVDLIVLDGATERWRMTLPVNVPVAFPFQTELLTTANTALNANLSAAGTVRICAQGYTAP